MAAPMRAEALRRYWMRRPYTFLTQITADGLCINNVRNGSLKKTFEVNSADLKLPRLQTNEFNLDCAGLRKPRLTSANIQTTTFSKSTPATMFPSDADQKITSDSEADYNTSESWKSNSSHSFTETKYVRTKQPDPMCVGNMKYGPALPEMRVASGRLSAKLRAYNKKKG